ncbi:MAG: hypothetical protein GX910_04575, partial [Clostridiaceae bacterium]|nr:hypothetical protein [Clostridiaceae bacterium]
MSDDQIRRRGSGNRPPQELMQDSRPLPGEQERDRSVETLLDRLESSLIDAKSVPFSEKCMVDREEMLFFVRMIREGLPEE